ncbi:hypothetical protein Lesp02_03840 [Lentzea sp. NBRC 105346]|uniref:hypothetical protein n=1 Tax=Lentzea sp. NBRC 105346 TaxID=3032205 RepID=UPI0024A4E80B|nr:hypothetical protein [Lentzea sp. NBRC 105346]GLZ28194.1 hypothetical protein Lesp02_03840 [Lentzea sp. NBRC 105346]
MRGDEALVVGSFCSWLRAQDWKVEVEAQFWDVVASRDGVKLCCEAKGKTAAAGLDMHTAYGQLLCRQPEVDDPATRYGLVIRDDPKSVRAALRAPARVRQLLRISIYAVADDGSVRLVP